MKIIKNYIMDCTKEKLQKQLNDLQKKIDNFNELEIGKWYKHNHADGIILYNKGDNYGYGYDMFGSWVNEGGWSFTSNAKDWREATNKEVEEALIKEAKKRGFKKGQKVKPCYSTPFEEWSLNGDGKLYFENSTDDRLYYFGCCIYSNGVWAEIIEDKKPTINGFELEDGKYNVTFGCKSFPKKFIRPFYENAKSLHVDSFKIDDNVISLNQLKEVVDYLKK